MIGVEDMSKYKVKLIKIINLKEYVIFWQNTEQFHRKAKRQEA